ncbi:MAG: hypothetical protein ACYTAF_10815 [Planctomycetota bacterium]|jgi:hypothetical protein
MYIVPTGALPDSIVVAIFLGLCGATFVAGAGIALWKLLNDSPPVGGITLAVLISSLFVGLRGPIALPALPVCCVVSCSAKASEFEELRETFTKTCGSFRTERRGTTR